jgi:hypothetical protein
MVVAGATEEEPPCCRRPPRAGRGRPSRAAAPLLLMVMMCAAAALVIEGSRPDHRASRFPMLCADAFQQTTTSRAPPTVLPRRRRILSGGQQQWPPPHVSSTQHDAASSFSGPRSACTAVIRGRRKRGGAVGLCLAAASPEVQERQDQDRQPREEQVEAAPPGSASESKILVVNDINPDPTRGVEIGSVVVAPGGTPSPPTPDDSSSSDDEAGLGIWAARGLLLLVAAIWGTNFAVRIGVVACFLLLLLVRFRFL